MWKRFRLLSRGNFWCKALLLLLYYNDQAVRINSWELLCQNRILAFIEIVFNRRFFVNYCLELSWSGFICTINLYNTGRKLCGVISFRSLTFVSGTRWVSIQDITWLPQFWKLRESQGILKLPEKLRKIQGNWKKNSGKLREWFF